MIFVKSREILVIAGLGPQTHSHGKCKIKRRVARDVRKSATSRREWAGRTQNPATRVDGRSVRVFRKSREIPPTFGFGRMAHSWRESEIKGRCIRIVQKSAKTRYEWGERDHDQAALVGGRLVRIFKKSRETQPVV